MKLSLKYYPRMLVWLASLALLWQIPQSSLKAEPLTSEQMQQILKELKSLTEIVEGQRVATRTSAVEMFQQAASSEKAAYEFYLKCIKMTKFDSVDASFSDFREWRSKNEDKLKEDSNLVAMRLQLQYLVMTLRAAEGVKRENLVPELEQFVAGIVANVEELEGQGWRTLREPVNRTAFAEAYELNQSLELEDWNLAPGDYGGVYEKTVFPYFRKEKPEELAAAWDRRIGLETNLLKLTQEDNEPAQQKYVEERLPRLHWQKSADIFRYASQQQGAFAMIQILKANADHPDATKWLKSFQELLAESAYANDYKEPESAP